MALRDDLYRLIEQLPETDLRDAFELLTALHERDAHSANRASAAEGSETRYQAAVVEGLREADAPSAKWVSQEDMERWLLSWGTDHELPPPSVRPRR
jgi:predicted transcriptional regulator